MTGLCAELRKRVSPVSRVKITKIGSLDGVVRFPFDRHLNELRRGDKLNSSASRVRKSRPNISAYRGGDGYDNIFLSRCGTLSIYYTTRRYVFDNIGIMMGKLLRDCTK